MANNDRLKQLAQFVLPQTLPRHIAIVMDGNGRWATQRHLPRVAGHRAGVQTVRNVVSACAHWRVEALTLFAFSSENWGRPTQEVQFLMNLFHTTLMNEIGSLHDNNIQLRIIGDRTGLASEVQKAIAHAEQLTLSNTGLKLSIAINYGGRWDITQATQKIAQKIKQNLLNPEDISDEILMQHLCLHDLPEPDLFIRTSGELRLSNFMLWQFAYTELYFCDSLWPDFDDAALYAAICAYASRNRRYGGVVETQKVLQHA